MYEVMRYWDDDQPEWDARNTLSRAAWRTSEMGCLALVEVSRPNARLVGGDLEGAIAS